MLRRFSFLMGLVLLCAGVLLASAVATVRGIVHDPQHRPIADAEVRLKAEHSDFTLTARTSVEGEFHFDSVPIGEYRITVSKTDFGAQEEKLTVLSGTAPILHIELQVAKQAQTVTVTSEAPPAQEESVTPTTLVSREEIAETPGAGQSNSVAMITNYVPGSYTTHDQLHVRGGHQVSWLIDGVSIPNTNIASNLGPQIDPKDIDMLEVQRGSYSADYGDRTYGVFNVAPRSGFERNNGAELILTAGNFYQTNDQLNFGGHTNRFAYYASLNGNRTNLGLETPTSAVIHDQANGYGGFTSMTYNLDAQNQFRLVAQLRQDFYQVPFDPNDPNAQGQFLRDSNKERDGFVLFSWVRTFSPGLVLTVSPFYHHNRVSYESSPFDQPSSATETLTSNYEGGQANLSWIAKRNNLRAGVFGFAEQANQLFGLICNVNDPAECSGVNPPVTTRPTGGLAAAYVEDQLKLTSWLSVDGGIRQTHYSADVVENASSPRVGASLRIPKLNWVFRAFYGHFYQPPPLSTISGPLLDAANNQNLGFIPLHGERDEEHQYGVTIPLWGWTIDGDTFLTRAKNYFDHNNFNNSNLFFPITIQGARISGWELTLRSPQIRKRGQIYLTYSNQLALGFGGINGGLTDFSFGDGFGLLDHDQRNTLHVGGQLTLPWRSYASTDIYYASGFANGDETLPGDHLQPHTTFDMTLGKNFGERISFSVTGLNVANRRVLLDNSLTFGGTHYNNPREIFVQLRYRFHY
ncbi:MAG TPA: TonB-dependent receptor [Candidatus Limnocylindrales bacterium]|nr:TonB-dependent receptor [Candidatus Limnocylindrales bacterium]